ncbi:FABP family protein [Rhodococcus hoagii]|nr:FABP family protein [Prescottella equi]
MASGRGRRLCGPDQRESGYWRVAGDGIPGSTKEEVVELLLTHSSGVVELFYGQALTQSSWELATDVVIRSEFRRTHRRRQASVRHRRGRRFWRTSKSASSPHGPSQPRFSARLQRYIG